MGVENKRRRHISFSQPIQQPVQQSGLAGSHFAREQEETLARVDPICQRRDRLFHRLREEEIARIGIDVERVFAQPEKLFVHKFPQASRVTIDPRLTLPIAPLVCADGSYCGIMAIAGMCSIASTSRSECSVLSWIRDTAITTKPSAKPPPNPPNEKKMGFGNAAWLGKFGGSSMVKCSPCCSCSRSVAIADWSRLFSKSLYPSRAV